MTLEAPFDGEPRAVFATRERIADVDWLAAGCQALVREYEARRGRVRLWVVGRQGEAARQLWSGNAYEMPLALGRPAGTDLADPRDAFWMARRERGARGARAVLERIALDEAGTVPVWRAPPGGRHRVVDLLDAQGPVLLVHRAEPGADRSRYIALAVDSGERVPLGGPSRFTNPLAAAEVIPLSYRRSDGLALGATLYLPAGHRPGERLPLVFTAYPRSFPDGEAAAGAPRYGSSGIGLPGRLLDRLLLSAGYAVLNEVSIPVVGKDGKPANDDFVEQVVAAADAAIAAAVGTGAVDPDRIGAVGHSYGAFLVANLLAHSRLFRAGVAVSGAYNRTLTPLGFQSERRTLWEARESYLRMSPLLYADRIEQPLLLMHGERDINAGTSPDQSIRMYEAIAATGGQARLVLLPYEGHIPRARESVVHLVAEALDWLDEHVRGSTRHLEARATKVAVR